MSITTVVSACPIRCHWRYHPVGAVAVLLGVFWFASRYPQLFSKADMWPSRAEHGFSTVMTVAPCRSLAAHPRRDVNWSTA